MNMREANALLTRAALLDPRMKRLDPREQADMATAWAEALEDVPLDQAIRAMVAHYRSESRPIMPADVLAEVGIETAIDPYEGWRDTGVELFNESKIAALEAAGVTELELEQHRGDHAWLRAKFPAAFEQDQIEGVSHE